MIHALHYEPQGQRPHDISPSEIDSSGEPRGYRD
jgi:hypothetical protein